MKKKATSLSLDVSATEVFTLDQTKRRSAEMLASISELVRKLAINISGIGIETAQFIYDAKLAPKLEYGLELVSPGAYRATVLDGPQVAFTQQMLSQQNSKRPELLQAEVGSTQIKFKTAKKIILKHHHFQQEQDTISLHLIKSNELSPNGFNNKLKKSLQLLGLNELETSADSIDRQALKITLAEKVKEKQRQETLEKITTRVTAEYKKHNSEWAPEEYLNLNWPPKQKQAYVRLRTWGDHLVRGAKPSCKQCKEAEANPTHLLVTCPQLADSRKILINELKTISPATYNLLKKSNSREKASIILGNNESAEANVKWPQCQEAFSRHTLRICDKLSS